MFDLSIDNKLRGCDVVKVKIGDVSGGQIRSRAIVIQQKTGRPAQFELLEPAAAFWSGSNAAAARSTNSYFQSRIDHGDHISSRQYARLVDEWVTGIGLQSDDYGTHSLAAIHHSLLKIRPVERSLLVAGILPGANLLRRRGKLPRGIECAYALLRVEIGPVRQAPVGDLAGVVATVGDLHAFAPNMHMADARLVLQDCDVLQRRSLYRNEIGEAARRQQANAVAMVDEPRGDGGGATQRLGRSEAQVADEDLQLQRVPFAIGRDREAAVSARHHRHAGSDGS